MNLTETTKTWINRSFFVCAVCCLALLYSTAASARGYGGHYSGGGHHYRHHGHHSNHGAYIAGGLILGSLISNSYRRHPERVVVQRTVVREPTVITNSPSRRLFRDRDGNCFERTRTKQNDELIVALDPSECDW